MFLLPRLLRRSATCATMGPALTGGWKWWIDVGSDISRCSFTYADKAKLHCDAKGSGGFDELMRHLKSDKVCLVCLSLCRSTIRAMLDEQLTLLCRSTIACCASSMVTRRATA